MRMAKQKKMVRMVLLFKLVQFYFMLLMLNAFALIIALKFWLPI